MALYLSRLILNPRSRAVRYDLADCHQLHRTVMAAFPDLPGAGEARAELGVLHRLDLAQHGGQLTLLVQSRAEPDWSHLPPDYLAETGGDPPNPACKAVDAVYDRLRAGDVLAFRLRANATRRLDKARNPNDALKGKRVALLTEEQQLDWLARKGEQCGFALLTVSVQAAENDQLEAVFGARRGEEPAHPDVRAMPGADSLGFKPRAAADGRMRLTFGGVLFDGHLRVTDAERFRAALSDGIGPGKAYGFGLLSLAPARGQE